PNWAHCSPHTPCAREGRHTECAVYFECPSIERTYVTTTPPTSSSPRGRNTHLLDRGAFLHNRRCRGQSASAPGRCGPARAVSLAIFHPRSVPAKPCPGETAREFGRRSGTGLGPPDRAIPPSAP